MQDDADTVEQALVMLAAYISDQLGHLEDGDAEGAEYVGRRLDQCWRWADRAVSEWVDARYQQPGGDSRDPSADAHRALRMARQFRAGDMPSGCPPLDVAKIQLLATDHVLYHLIRAVRNGDERRVAVTAHVARRAFSAYRLAKYRWMDAALEAGDLSYENSYRWLEA